MLYLKPADFEDIEKEHAFVAEVPADENGFINNYHYVFRIKLSDEHPHGF